MWDEQKFFEEFKKTNDNIKPSQDFTKRLSEAVEEETTNKIVPFYKSKKKISILAATAAALVLLVTGIGMYNTIDFGEDCDDYNVSHNDLDDDDLDDDNLDEDDSDGFNSKINAGLNMNTTTVSADELIEEIEQASKVVCEGQKLDNSQISRLIKKIEKADILDDELADHLDEDVIAEYKIYAENVWIVEEYESGAIYISLK